MLEDLSDDGPLFDEGNDLHLTSAAGAGQGIHLVDLLQYSRPVAASLEGEMLGGRVRLRGAVDGRRPGQRETLFTSLAARGVGIAAVVADHLLVGIRNVGSHQSNPVQSIHGAGDSLVGAVLDLSGLGLVLESSAGETGSQDISGQPFQSRLIVSINPRPTVDLEARRLPAAEPIGELAAEAALGGQHLQDVVLEQPREHFIVKRAEGMKLPLPIPDTMADQ